MGPLTPEERRAKFANKSIQTGLRSKGFRKLTVEEQEKLLANLSPEKTVSRLEELRVLREASKSVKVPMETELKVYELSAKEIIEQDKYDALVPVLSNLVKLSDPKHLEDNFGSQNVTEINHDKKLEKVYQTYNWLYIILLSNTKQFNEALELCYDDRDFRYVRCILTNDQPLLESFILNETDSLSKQLMAKAPLNKYKDTIRWVFEHPSKRKK
ncbi:hypothetical protein DASB73_011340 [Starmerella bacillaris]|uniref:Uncharacterized protein n=1 Tax=Starmerella bacillaris TaxID=1247836 RepID=A0AAV5RF26_STABA|nr:hypothetical protein DASB73_011340 [Starmerella bacillaris]